MPAQGRLGDKSQAPADGHGCPACPHPVIGPAVQGSPNVFVNSRPAVRVGDMGIHAACCGPNMWKAVEGSATVFFNGKPAHRMGDKDQHCGGSGKLINGSSNVYVGDSGGSGASTPCDQAQLAKDAAKSGTPFFEAAKTAAEKAKEAAVQKAKEFAKQVSDKIQQGAENAAKQRKSQQKEGWKLKEAGLSIGAKQGYTDFEPKDSIKVGVEIEKKIHDDQAMFYGNENNNVKIGHTEESVSLKYEHDLLKGTHEVKAEAKTSATAFEAQAKGGLGDGMLEGSANVKIGHAEATAGAGYGYNPDEGEFTARAEAKAKVSVVEAEVKGSAARGLIEAGAKGEALSAEAEASAGVTISDEKIEIGAKAGAEANLVKGEAEGRVNITGKTIYDNTIGSFIGWVSPDSKFKSAAKWLDHGIVIGAKGEAGIGAAASAEAKAGVEDGVAYAEAGVKLGAGPMAGLKLLIGIK